LLHLVRAPSASRRDRAHRAFQRTARAQKLRIVDRIDARVLKPAFEQEFDALRES